MHLTNFEESALEGEHGHAVASSYRVLLSLGEFLGADKLIPITSAHVSGVNYANIGEEGLGFLEKMSKDGKVSVKTTLNPCGVEMERPESLKAPKDFVRRQKKIIESYIRMGVDPTLTCVPYEFENKPRRGSHIAWAESSASLYANSVIGAMTNRESAISSLASAIVGKTPNAGMHLKKNRRPGVVVSVETPLNTVSDFGLLGIFGGRLTSMPVGYTKLKGLDKVRGKALGAGIGTSGSSPMFISLESSPKGVEVVPFTSKELSDLRHADSSKSQPQMILLGCPFYTVEEVKTLAKKLQGRVMRKPTFLHLSRTVYSDAKRLGRLQTIEGAGVKVVQDACPSRTPMGRWMGMDSVATDSPKGAFYMKNALKYDVNVVDIDSLLESYSASGA